VDPSSIAFKGSLRDGKTHTYFGIFWHRPGTSSIAVTAHRRPRMARCHGPILRSRSHGHPLLQVGQCGFDQRSVAEKPAAGDCLFCHRSVIDPQGRPNPIFEGHALSGDVRVGWCDERRLYLLRGTGTDRLARVFDRIDRCDGQLGWFVPPNSRIDCLLAFILVDRISSKPAAAVPWFGTQAKHVAVLDEDVSLMRPQHPARSVAKPT
jgi:hypothetical protein